MQRGFVAGKERRESGGLPACAGDERGERISELVRWVERAVVPLVLAARVTPVRAGDVNEMAALVDVLERVQQRFLPAGKKRDGEKRER